jgi:hypothetical protein
MRPHIFRTHDGGKTWTEIVTGIPDGAPVNAVREDPKKKGLLFAGTEREVFVSFDDGGHWQSLRQNMAASSVRDVIVKDDDLVAATHGRGFWILDDITPLRQIGEQTVGTAAVLFKPETAIRVRWNMNTDTPLPPDEPALKNPPDGAILNYYLGTAPAGPVTIEVLDAAGKVVRKYASTDPVDTVDPNTLAVPPYWVRPGRSLPATAGMHRWLWDMKYTPLASGGRGGYPMTAVYQDTPQSRTSIWAAPGTYTVRLTLDGKSYTQPLTLKMDPRVKTPALGLSQQFTLSKGLYDDSLAVTKALEELRAARAQLQQAKGATAEQIAALDKKAAAIEGGGGGGGRGGRGGGAAASGPETLSSVASGIPALLNILSGADVTPSAQVTAAVNARRAAVAKVLAEWRSLKAEIAVLGLDRVR